MSGVVGTGPTVNGVPPGYTVVHQLDGQILLIPPETFQGYVPISPPSAAQQLGQAVASVHSALVDAGSMVPTAIAAPLTVASLPTAIQAGFEVAASVASGNYVAAVTTGVPLLITGVMALYASLSETRKPSNDEIAAHLSTLSRDELVRLLKFDGAAVGGATHAADVQDQTGVPTASGINRG